MCTKNGQETKMSVSETAFRKQREGSVPQSENNLAEDMLVGNGDVRLLCGSLFSQGSVRCKAA